MDDLENQSYPIFSSERRESLNSQTTSPDPPVRPRAKSGDGRDDGGWSSGGEHGGGGSDAGAGACGGEEEVEDESDGGGGRERREFLRAEMDAGPPGPGGVAPLREADDDDDEEVEMITLVHVQQPFHQYLFPAGPGGAAFYAASSVVESVRTAQEENSAIVLSLGLRMCIESTVKEETLILIGDPKDMICQATEQMHMDLLILGSRGLGKIKRAFLGSVSDYCAHHAKCPILTVKPPKEASKQ